MANSFSPIGISAVKLLARLAAKKAVQNELRDQGVRVSLYPYADLMRQTGEYLDKHPELYQQALKRAKRMIAEGMFGERAQRAYLNNNAQRQSERISMSSAVQISSEKIDIEREIAWLLAQQYRGRAWGLVTRSKDDDLRICAGEYGWANPYSAAVGAMPSWLLASVQREGKWRKD
jgi:hypothetical protein